MLFNAVLSCFVVGGELIIESSSRCFLHALLLLWSSPANRYYTIFLNHFIFSPFLCWPWMLFELCFGYYRCVLNGCYVLLYLTDENSAFPRRPILQWPPSPFFAAISFYSVFTFLSFFLSASVSPPFYFFRDILTSLILFSFSFSFPFCCFFFLFFSFLFSRMTASTNCIWWMVLYGRFADQSSPSTITTATLCYYLDNDCYSY